MINRFKVCLCVFLLLCAAAAPALATEEDHAILSAQSLLTEVYGYTQEEAEAFDYQVTETDTEWQISFAPKAHPDWVYTGAFRKTDGLFVDGSSPFNTGYAGYPGENGVRGTLSATAKNGWFTQWDSEAKAAFHEELNRQGIQPSGSLLNGLNTEGYTAAQAVKDYFLSCYGETSAWPEALTAWRDEVLASLTPSTEPSPTGNAAEATTGSAEAAFTDAPESLRTQNLLVSSSQQNDTVTEFNGETPDVLAPVLAQPHLEGWTCLCGAFYEKTNNTAASPSGYGLAAFEKDGTRLLTTLYRFSASDEWQVAPVGEKALLANRDFSITYNGDNQTFDIIYPVSDKVNEWYCCRIVFYSVDLTRYPLCRLISYNRWDAADGSGVMIDHQSGRSDTCWYHVTTVSADGSAVEENIPVLFSTFLDHLDVSQFPTDAEACRQAAAGAPVLADGYGITAGVHLRAKTSSHSTDLGMLQSSVLVQVLETLPGDPWPWYHVQLGSLEGYVSSVYVEYEDPSLLLGVMQQRQPLLVAKTRRACALKKGTGFLDGKVQDLAQGTVMHVLATRGKWLYVSIPQGEIGWMMDVNGMCGFVKAGDVAQAVSPVQLEWLE